MKSVVIKVGKSQYLVKEGDELIVDRIKRDDKALEKNDKVEIEEVFLVIDDKKIKVGQPNVKGAKVVLKILEESKGKKVRVATFKAKSRYRRTLGFRPIQAKVKVDKITA